MLLYATGPCVRLNEEQDESTRSTEVVSVQLMGRGGHAPHPKPERHMLLLPSFFLCSFHSLPLSDSKPPPHLCLPSVVLLLSIIVRNNISSGSISALHNKGFLSGHKGPFGCRDSWHVAFCDDTQK